MRHVQVTVPRGKQGDVLDLLETEDVDYVVTEECSDRRYDAVVSFTLPTNAVEPTLDALHDIGIGEESYTVVFDARAVVSERFEDVRAEFATGSVAEEQISRQELVARAEELTPTFSVFMTMTLISTVVATSGLLLDSPAVVVGSMVIAPLIGPALAASVGTVVNEQELVTTGVRYQVTGVAVGIVGAAVFAWLLRGTMVVPPGTNITEIGEVAERVAPELLLLPVAVGAGIAGVLSLSVGFSVALVGVMIAAALVPPMAAAGIALAWGLPAAALGSTVLVAVNLLAVNLAGQLTLWYTGYRPGSWFEIPSAERRMVSRVAGLVVAVLVLSAFLAGVSFTASQVSTFEQTARNEATAVLSDYDDVRLLSVQVVIRDRGLPFGRSLDASEQVEVVVVEVGGPIGAYDSTIADRVSQRINANAAENVTVQVQFTPTERREPTTATEAS